MHHPFAIKTGKVAGDYRWAGPTSQCVCGSTLFYMLASFDPETRLPGFYVLDGMCVACEVLVHLPTPIDEVPPVPAPLHLFEITHEGADLRCPACGSDENVVLTDVPEAGVWAQCQTFDCGHLFKPRATNPGEQPSDE